MDCVVVLNHLFGNIYSFFTLFDYSLVFFLEFLNYLIEILTCQNFSGGFVSSSGIIANILLEVVYDVDANCGFSIVLMRYN